VKIYVINLKRRTDRKEKIINAFTNLNFNNYEFVEAYDALEYIPTPLDFNNKAATRLQRQLSIPEVCTSLSHKKAMKQILSQNDSHGIIIEDDCPITEELINFANGESPPCDIVMLGYYTSNENNFCPTYKHQSYKYDIMDICSDTRVYFKSTNVINDKYYQFDKKSYQIDFLHGGHCYCLSKIGCALFIKKNTPVIMEADNIWNFYEVNVRGIRPMLVEIERDRIDSDIETERKKMQDLLEFSELFLKRIHHSEFGT
jgi:hypothetical protein